MLPVVQLDAKGLYTFTNVLSLSPPGAMTVANNTVIDRPGIIETRRGFNFFGNALPSAGIKGFIYSARLLWYCTGGQLVYDSTGAGIWSTYSGSFFPPTNNFMFSTQANGNFYFTTNNGTYKIAGLTGTPQQAGAPPALDLTAAVAGAGSAVINNVQVAYSVLWTYTDANNNLILGAPSEWAIVVNTAGSTQNVTVVVTIPANITTSYTLQVYRTPATSSQTVTPGNNFQLAMTHTPTAGEIAALTLTLTDTIPDVLLGAYLYTADGQPNNLPNTQPPLAQDICTFNGMTFYLNWQTIQQMNLTLDSVGAANGIQVADTITITDIASTTAYVYTGAAGNNAAARQFKVDTSSTIAANIDATGRNICAMINQDPNNTLWYAYYQTGTSLLPGEIILSARNLSGGKFYINSSRTTCWTPAIPTAATTYVSGNFSNPSGFIVSKVNQPEAVPLAYATPVQTGTVSVILYRGLALQDALYLFSNVGVFRVTGTDPTALQVVLFDSSAVLIGLNTPQILNNSIYYYSTQGICNVSSGGNQIVSRNVERDVLSLSVLSNFTSLAFGCAYESDRKYFLYSPTTSADATATQTYVYNWITQCWTYWNRPTGAAIVNTATGLLYLTDGSSNVFRERKSYTNSDYADEQYTVTINTIGSGTLTLASSVNVQIGDTITQTVSGTPWSAQITGNNTGTGVVNVSSTIGFTAGSATDYRAIVTSVQYTPITCGFPEYIKRIMIWEFMFENANFSSMTVNFTTDFVNTPVAQTIAPKLANGWGTQNWGTFNWGVSTIFEQVIPCWPALNMLQGHWFILQFGLTQAFTSIALDGVAATFDIISTRGR